MTTPFQELGDGVFRRRYESLDLNIGVVIGDEGVLVIDTRASHQQARELKSELTQLTSLPVRWVVDTHWHWDHTFGNAEFPEAELWGHTECRRVLIERGEAARARVLDMVEVKDRSQIEEVMILPPNHLVEDSAAIDIGEGRSVAVQYLGLGHTEGDIVITAPDGVVFAGDLLEEGAPPSFGDSYPIAWPDTVARLLSLVSGTVVPGHGDVMNEKTAAGQLEELREVARIGKAAMDQGLHPDEVDVTSAPYPEHQMRIAVERALLELGG